MANDFKPFATGPGANVTPQADWENLPALLGGFVSGKASAAQINKALRQASFIAAALAQYTADKSGEDVLDDGDVAGFIAKMADAFGEDFQPKNDKLTAFAGLAGAANRLPYFTGANALALTALSAVGRDLIGKATVAEVLTYLGLGSLKYGAPMIGELVEWPRSEMPQEIWPDMTMEFIPYMAQSFDAVKYPLLSQLHPTNVLPADMRGQAPRGWDNGRGVDAGRVMMSEQGDAIRNITGSVITASNIGLLRNSSIAAGAFVVGSTSYSTALQGGDGSNAGRQLLFDASAAGVPTAAENRMKNVAWNMIVRAK